jgi:DNA-binding IclR family transcriptional regulator
MLLAWQGEEHVRNLYADREIPLYPGGIEYLLKDLRVVREQGFAYAVQRPQPLNSSVAVPLGSPPYAAIALGGQVPAETVEESVEILNAAAGEIEKTPAPAPAGK